MTPEDMVLKAEQAADSAQLLFDNGDPDGACNRAYYAMFDIARAALIAVGQPDTGKTHKGVLNAFSQHFVQTGIFDRETGRLLKLVETYRYVADYGGDVITVEDAGKMVAQARDFVSKVVAEISSTPKP